MSTRSFCPFPDEVRKLTPAIAPSVQLISAFLTGYHQLGELASPTVMNKPSLPQSALTVASSPRVTTLRPLTRRARRYK